MTRAIARAAPFRSTAMTPTGFEGGPRPNNTTWVGKTIADLYKSRMLLWC